jgi:SAM-dependent methyltransferase
MFKDHFSKLAESYAKYRPHYPPELFQYLASLCSEHDLAWDCATGNGQAAAGLAPFFKRILATDLSKEQLSQSIPNGKIVYRLASAENSGLESESVDLITSANAAHWFNFELFYHEVKRVLKSDGKIGLWCYLHSGITKEIDKIAKHYAYEILKSYWPPERKYVEEKYQTLPFPFEEIKAPVFKMNLQWNFFNFTGYLKTWSASQRYLEEKKKDPLDLIKEDLRKSWGEPETVRTVSWNIHLRIGRLPCQK